MYHICKSYNSEKRTSTRTKVTYENSERFLSARFNRAYAAEVVNNRKLLTDTTGSITTTHHLKVICFVITIFATITK